MITSANVLLPEPPLPAQSGPFELPPFHRLRLSNGIRIVLAEYNVVPLVHLHCAVASGAQYDPPGLEGLASMVMPLLREGTQTRSVTQIIEETENQGADILTNVDWDVGSLVVELLTSDLGLGIELLFDLARYPTFPDQAVENMRKRQIAKLIQQQWQPTELANVWFAKSLYDDTVYGRPLLGTKESLINIDQEKLVAFHREHFGLGSMVLIVVGSFCSEELTRKLESILPDTRPEHIPEPPVIKPPDLTSTRIYLVNLPDAAQTEIRLGHVGIPRSHPDFPRLPLLSGILSNRLSFNLRESRGYTYYVRSRFAARGGPGPFVISAGIDNSYVGVAVREIVNEIERLQQEPVTDAEIIACRSSLISFFLRSFQSIHELAGQLTQLEINNLPGDYFYHYADVIRSTSREELVSLARRYLHPRCLTIVAAGPARVLRDQLSRCGELTEINVAVESALSSGETDGRPKL